MFYLSKVNEYYPIMVFGQYFLVFGIIPLASDEIVSCNAKEIPNDKTDAKVTTESADTPTSVKAYITNTAINPM